MIRTARAWFRNSNTAIAVTVGVVGGYALYLLLEAFAGGVVYATIFDDGRTGGDRTFDIGLISVYYPNLVTEFVAVLLLGAVAYVLFIWPGGEPIEEYPETRECPECKSEIWFDATRCAFCTSVVAQQAAEE